MPRLHQASSNAMLTRPSRAGQNSDPDPTTIQSLHWFWNPTLGTWSMECAAIWGERQRLGSMRTTLNHCVTLAESLHLSALSVLLPGLSLGAAKEGVKGGRLRRSSLNGKCCRCLDYYHCHPGWVDAGSVRSKFCLEGWGWATSGLKVLNHNPFPVTRVPRAKLQQILVKKMG